MQKMDWVAKGTPFMQKMDWVAKERCRPASTWMRIYQSIHAFVVRQRPPPHPANVFLPFPLTNSFNKVEATLIFKLVSPLLDEQCGTKVSTIPCMSEWAFGISIWKYRQKPKSSNINTLWASTFRLDMYTYIKKMMYTYVYFSCELRNHSLNWGLNQLTHNKGCAMQVGKLWVWWKIIFSNL
jgi:hypothetical protein